MEKRAVKRNIIVVCYLVLFLVLIFAIYAIVKPDPTCNDGIKNQLEEDIDCGGPCAACLEDYDIQELIVENIEWVDTATNNFDTVVTVKNPNSLFGVSTVQYKLKYFDIDGEIIKETAWYKNYLLPKQEKYLLAQEVELAEAPVKIEIEFGEVIWKKFTVEQENPRLEIIMTEFSNSFQQDLSGFYRVKGTLINESSLDFETIKINVILRDKEGILLATNSQVVNTIHSQEKRDFDLPFSSDYNMNRVSKIEIKPETDIFNSDNFIKFFGIIEGEN